jgi:hypothetical protein
VENIGVLVHTLKFGAMKKYWCAGACTKIWCCTERCWCAGARAKYSTVWCILSDACIILVHFLHIHNNGTCGVRNFDITQRDFFRAHTIWVYVVAWQFS